MQSIKLAKVVLIALALAIGAWSQVKPSTQSDSIREMEERAAHEPGNARLQSQLGVAYFNRARDGEAPAIDKAVIAFERSVSLAPSDLATTRWLGLTYFTRVSFLSRARSDPREIVAVLEKARAAFDRVLEQQPNDPVGLGAHGSVLTVLAGYERKMDLFARGIEEMNRAVSANPTDSNARLLRALALINFPPPMRNLKDARDDFTAILDKLPQGYNDRGEAVLHVYLGDIDFELKDPALARTQYEAAARLAQPASEVARTRLASLERGGPRADEIQRYRTTAGNCAECHGH